MEYVNIGKEPIRASMIGFGTGSSGFTGDNKQTRLGVRELSDLLHYGLDKGINLWDTGYSYGTYPHVSEALKNIGRDRVVISTKFSDSLERTVEKRIEETLRVFRTDYLDICLLHGVRNPFEFRMRSGALNALLKARDKGYVRAIGLSAHGIGGIEAALHTPEIELLFARINSTGASMDAYQENLLSKFVAVPYVKETARRIIPRRLIPSFSAQVESLQSSTREQEMVKGLLSRFHSGGRTVFAMKVFGAGKLADRVEESMRFIMSLGYISVYLLGMTSRREVDENVKIYNDIKEKRLSRRWRESTPAAL